MPDVIGPNGLQVKDAAEITQELVTGLQSIYGASINVDQNSPDGQTVGIITQEAVDIREVAVAVNNSFDPDLAVGITLDQRVAINNIARVGGTYTVQPIELVITDTVTLQGLDADYADPNGTGYTIQDSSGNKFILATTDTLTAGTYTRDFRAQLVGDVDVPINTITVPVTVVLGVASVNNPSAAISVGQTQETDAQLRTRRARSTALAAAGYLNGLLGTVLALPGVTEAQLYENVTDSTDANGIPAHGMWLVVAGGATPDIANAIYTKKSYGANMKGDEEYDITTPSGVPFTAKWDNPVAADLHIRFDIQTTVDGYNFDETSIKQYMADTLNYGIGEYAETSAVTAAAVAAIAAQGGGGVPVNVEISSNGSAWTDYLPAPTLASEWTLDPSRITITVVP